MFGDIKHFGTPVWKTRFGMFSTLTGLIHIKKSSLLLIFVFLRSFTGSAQYVQSDRMEIPIGDEEGMFEVVPAEKDGLFLQRRYRFSDGDKLQLISLDTSFQVKWQGYLPIDARFELMGKRNFHNKMYLLFRHRELARKDLELIILDNASGDFVKHTVKNFIPFVPSDFQISDKAAIVGGYFNNVPVVIYYSLRNQTTKVLPGLFNEPGELTQIKTDSTGAFEVLISARNVESQKTIFIKSYDAEGDLIMQTPLGVDANKHLLFARSIKTENNLHFIAGTYSNSRSSDYSRGIFVARIDPNGMQQIRYYNYGDLGNFFKYLKAKRELRVKERIEHRRVNGKKIRFNYRFIVHEIVPYNGQFVLLGEAFYPRYVNMDHSLYSFFNPLPSNVGPIRNGRIFDGYRYTHAVVMGFDKNGKLLWDNSFEINDVKTLTLDQFVRLETQSDKIALLYVFDNKLRSKIIQGNNVIEGKTYYPLQDPSAKDMRNERGVGSTLNYWYDRYFYAFGVQEINNSPNMPKRVFFLSKINYAKNTDNR
jgi:hypothetical protein